MAVSKSQQASVNKYVKANYDRINVTMPKGKKESIQIHAEARGESVNAYINTAIAQRMERDSAPQKAAGAPARVGVVSLPYETLEAAQRAAEAAGEDIPQFIERAIQGQAERDVDSRIAEVSATNMLLDKLKSGELSGKNRSIAEEFLLARGVDPYTGERLQKEA